MSTFSEGFLDAPLLSDRVSAWVGKFRRRSDLERELELIGDIELRDMGISRGTLEHAARM